jgi:maltodextrin utilization protein YvdJ
MMDKANDQIQQTLANMRSEVERMTHEQNNEKSKEEESAKFAGFEKTAVDTKPEQPQFSLRVHQTSFVL